MFLAIIVVILTFIFLTGGDTTEARRNCVCARRVVARGTKLR